MPKITAQQTDSGSGWTALATSASGIAQACPPAARERLQQLLVGVAVSGCVWRSELRGALKGVAHYGNWLSVGGLDREVFAEHGVESAIPAFVPRQFTECTDVLSREWEAELERVEEAAVMRRHARRSHHYQVTVGLIERFYRQLKAGVPTTAAAVASDVVVASDDRRIFAEKCIAACREVAAMYPESIVPNGHEQSTFAMARHTARKIEDRISGLWFAGDRAQAGFANRVHSQTGTPEDVESQRLAVERRRSDVKGRSRPPRGDGSA